jgi:hypothetical protein
MARKEWRFSEERILIENYEKATISELEKLLPGRNADSINSKIKRLKILGKLKGNKSESAIQRAYQQRQKDDEGVIWSDVLDVLFNK